VLGGLAVAAVLVAGIASAGGELEQASAALGDAGRRALKAAAKGAIWFAVHHGSPGDEPRARCRGAGLRGKVRWPRRI
jgi:hypothetical protein